MLSPQSRSLRDPSGCGGYASSQRGMTFKCLLPAYQSEPLSWLCGWAPLSAQRNEHLELDSLMHLYWPHQQDDSKRSGPTICTTWAGAPGRKELPWAKQQEAEAARVQNKKKQVTSGKGICNESLRELKQTVYQQPALPWCRRASPLTKSHTCPPFLFHTLPPQPPPSSISSLNSSFWALSRGATA